MVIALIVYRIGWWATIYCQQILLGMLTIFGRYNGLSRCCPNGRGLGQMDDKVSDGTFLWSDVVLRGILCVAPVRHRAVHTGGEPDGDNRQRDNDGGIFAELILLGRLPDGRKHRGIEMPEPRTRPCGMDDTGR